MKKDKYKTKDRLISELEEARHRIAELEVLDTERKEATEETKWLARFPSDNPNPVLRVARDGTILYANQASSALLNMWCSQVGSVIPESLSKFVTDVLRSGLSKTAEVECEEQILALTFTPVVDADIVYLYGLDITERIQAGKALQSSEAWFSTTLRSIGDAVIATDDKAYVKLINPVAQALTGWNEKDAVGKPLGNVFNIVNEKTGKKAGNPVARVIREGIVVGLANHTALIAKDGTRLSIDDSGSPIKDDKGNIIGAILIFRDVTERRKLEHNLNERVKELGCLYGIAEITERPGITLEKIYQGAVEMFPHSYQYPEVACAQLTIDGKEFKTANYRETGWKQSTDIKVHGRKAGVIEAVYLEERPTSDEGPFLKEERLLIAAAAERLGRITERIQEEQNFKNSLDNSPLGVRIVTAEGELLYANQAILDIYGYSSFGELKNTLSKQRYTPEGYAQYRERVKDRKLGKPVPDSYEISIIREDGEARCLQTFRREVAWNGETQFQSIYQDITERKQLEQTLQEEKKLLEVTMRSTGDGVITTDIEGKVVLLNRVAEQLTDWTQDKATGKPLEEIFHIINEHTRKRIPNPVKTVLKTGRIVGLINHAVLISRDGTEHIIADSGAPIHDEQGNLFGVVLVFRDITEARKLEEEILKTEKLESIGILAGGIAHDFNNILTGIIGNISLAKRHIKSGSEAEERLTEAEKAGWRARDLTQQLLTFSSGGAPVKKIISPGKLIEDTVGFVLRGSNIKPEFSLPDDLWAIEADEGQVSQVISNIIINAVQAMPQGGTIKIEINNLVISRRRTLPLPMGNYVKMIVTDQGAGIAKEHLARIFEPFFTTKQKGSGLGLSTTYSIINKHGGHITVESKPDVGTTVQVYLPAFIETSPIREEVTEEVVLVGRGRILVMDDEEAIRSLLDRILTNAGFEVELTSNGTEAIEQYSKAKESKQPFDMVILDLTVPGGMGGKETLEKLLELDPEVKAIVSSGYANDPIISEYKKYGFSAIVTKPYSVAQIEKALQSLISME